MAGLLAGNVLPVTPAADDARASAEGSPSASIHPVPVTRVRFRDPALILRHVGEDLVRRPAGAAGIGPASPLIFRAHTGRQPRRPTTRPRRACRPTYLHAEIESSAAEIPRSEKE